MMDSLRKHDMAVSATCSSCSQSQRRVSMAYYLSPPRGRAIELGCQCILIHRRVAKGCLIADAEKVGMSAVDDRYIIRVNQSVLNKRPPNRVKGSAWHRF